MNIINACIRSFVHFTPTHSLTHSLLQAGGADIASYAEISDYVVNMLEVLRALVPFYQAPNKMQDLGNFAYKLLNYREGFKVTYFMTT